MDYACLEDLPMCPSLCFIFFVFFVFFVFFAYRPCFVVLLWC